MKRSVKNRIRRLRRKRCKWYGPEGRCRAKALYRNSWGKEAVDDDHDYCARHWRDMRNITRAKRLHRRTHLRSVQGSSGEPQAGPVLRVKPRCIACGRPFDPVRPGATACPDCGEAA